MATSPKAPSAVAKPAAVKKTAAKKSTPAAAKTVAIETTPAKAPAARKAAAPKRTPSSKTVLQASTAPKPTLTTEQRNHYVSVAAFYIAERRGFTLGDPAADWLAAEAEIDRLIASGHFFP